MLKCILGLAILSLILLVAQLFDIKLGVNLHCKIRFTSTTLNIKLYNYYTPLDLAINRRIKA